MKNLRNKIKNTKGITLIALIITIIVTLILAGVAISMATGDGLINKTQYAVEKHKEVQVREKAQMLLFEYTAEKVETGKTLPKFLEEKGISFEEEETMLMMEMDEYIVTVDKKTYEIISVEKATNQVKITLNKNVVDIGEELKATIVLAKNINKNTCKYAFEKQDVNVAEGDITTSVPDGLEITLPTNTKGNYYFYLLYNNGKENKIKKVPVTVGIAVEEIVLNKTSVTLDKGETQNLSITEIKPSNATDKTTEWTSLDTTVATVDTNGIVTAVKGGTAKIRATAKDGSGVYGECTVTVNPKLVDSVTFEKETESIKLGGEKVLAVTVLPADADNTELEWTSTNSKIKVDSTGKVTLDGAVAGDTATITAKSKDGTNKTATCTISVLEQTAEISTVTNHGANSLNAYSWSELEEIARLISLNYETEEGASKITKSTEEITVKLPGHENPITIGIGDTKTLGSNTVRLIGFNHDKLADEDPYGDGKPHTYAGMTFDFTDAYGSNRAMFSSFRSDANWDGSEMKTYLAGQVGNIENLMGGDCSGLIKNVRKAYLPSITATTPSYGNYKLWLLACSELWHAWSSYANNGWGYARASESTMYPSGDSQTQYEFYRKNDSEPGASSSVRVKTGSYNAWLRSPYAATPREDYWMAFCTIWNREYHRYDGSQSCDYCGETKCVVAPAFCL